MNRIARNQSKAGWDERCLRVPPSSFPTRDSGFVLLIVLLVLAIGATVLAAAARTGGQAALLAGSEQRQLQLRWGALSCQAVVLPAAEDLMTPQPPRKPSPEWWHDIQLGSMTFHLVLGDEQAKVNVNRMLDLRGESWLTGCIRRLQVGDRQTPPVELRPLEQKDAAGQVLPRFLSFDQVLRFDHPSQLVGVADQDGTVLRRRLTLWSDGRVNLKTAEMAVLREALAGKVADSQWNALEALRTSNADFTMTDVSAQLQLRADQLQTMNLLTSLGSDSYSLWVIAVDRGFSHYRLYVRGGGGSGQGQLLTFVW